MKQRPSKNFSPYVIIKKLSFHELVILYNRHGKFGYCLSLCKLDSIEMFGGAYAGKQTSIPSFLPIRAVRCLSARSKGHISDVNKFLKLLKQVIHVKGGGQ
ncbi:hypothetical protein HNY73_018945 [Argiope bruennichi]|uniref:Uncharacterized protein n=1 Tax=Argiope bruennichi TaxID=94029 RepID=A0A8T0EJK4_ARGBR|nr:hypothetical protein HNY73_018945 [Argiope bruennichi]